MAPLDSAGSICQAVRYFAVISSEIPTSDGVDHEENIILGIDVEEGSSADDQVGDSDAKIGFILPITGNIVVRLNGDT